MTMADSVHAAILHVKMRGRQSQKSGHSPAARHWHGPTEGEQWNLLGSGIALPGEPIRSSIVRLPEEGRQTISSSGTPQQGLDRQGRWQNANLMNVDD